MTDFNKAREQCLRALDIIEQTQLQVFLQQPLPDPGMLRKRIDALASHRLDEAVAQMRHLLGDVLLRYNDPFANYINPAQHTRYQQRREGGFVGVGLKFRAVVDDYPVVIGALSGGPLASHDVRPGDRILRVNDTDLRDNSTRQVSALLMGEAGSAVRLELQRSSSSSDVPASHTVNAIRATVVLHYARSELLDGDIGYMKITRFGGSTHERVRLLVSGLLATSLKGLVIDLRDNPGGSTRAARHIMSMFDKAPWVFCEQYKSGAVKRLPRGGSWISDVPLVLLVNERSMSSSEILAGALQVYKRAILVGTPTYGKGLIQKVFSLEPPLGGAVRTTIAMYGSPDHKLIHGRGLVPDIYVPNSPEGLFRETGSVNISSAARAFRRSLLIEDLAQKFPVEKARALSLLPDRQLQVAVQHLQNA